MGGANMEAFETQKIPVAEIRPCPLLGETTILEKQVAALARTPQETGAPATASGSPLGREGEAQVRADFGCALVGRSQAAGKAHHRRSHRDSFGSAGSARRTPGRHRNR